MNNTVCPVCGGRKAEGVMTFTADLNDTLVVVRGVPATVCSLCGNEWLADAIASELERIVEDARKKRRVVEVAQFNPIVRQSSASTLQSQRE